uniref:Uncharacterized protein n=1 Tax=Ananas comosus var. bracteatus TaxID=296719 RepID=A0A6V7QDU0_ANACO|nr:unnamed protein product [Ananas comosus var. bracteatus]
MSWGLGWKRPSEIFHLTLDYGDSDPNADPSPTPSTSPPAAASSAAPPRRPPPPPQEISFPDRARLVGGGRRGSGRAPAPVAAHGRAPPAARRRGAGSARRWGKVRGDRYEGREAAGTAAVGADGKGGGVGAAERWRCGAHAADPIEFGTIGIA